MIRLVIATGNAGKVRDFQTVFDSANMEVEVLSIKDFGGMPHVDETEPDFKGNALLKAKAAHAILPVNSDFWLLADDSGLSVDYLNGEPGVLSARFAGENATDEENRIKLLKLLQDVSDLQRSASFVCHLCLIDPTGQVNHFEGRCLGKIAFEASGGNGFGYDPLFIPHGETSTWGDLDLGSKNQESHRGNACKKLIAWLAN